MTTKKKPGMTALLCLLLVFFALMTGCSGSEGNEPESDAAEPDLEMFMGGWGSLDSPYDDCVVAEFTDDDGKLKVNFAAIPGGGYYVVFDKEDISFDGDKMTCVNGLIVTEGKDFSEGILVASPAETTEGGYTFIVSSEEGEFPETPDYVYTKVGNTREELQAWIDEHHEPL